MNKLIITCLTKELFIRVSEKLASEGYKYFGYDSFLKGLNWSERNNTILASDSSCGFCYLEYYQKDNFYKDYKFLTAEQYLCISKNNKTIMNKITSQIKRIFNLSLQKQYKAGLIDDCGKLTEQGHIELNGLVRDSFDDELTKIAEEIIKEEKDSK